MDNEYMTRQNGGRLAHARVRASTVGLKAAL
jgi:hypothetical protein